MAICIAGMHRSGTSLVARVLKECGVFLGREEDLLPARPDNRDGFWEHAALTELNDELLAALGGSWDDPPKLPDGWERSTELEPLERRARDLLAPLRERFPWGWKDPRSSLTLPFWRRAAGEELQVVVCLRHPSEVVGSLVARGGMQAERAGELALRYLKALEHGTEPSGRVVVEYESFLAEPGAEVQRLADALGLKPEPLQVARALETVNGALHNQKREQEVSPELLATYEALRTEARRARAPAEPPNLETQLEAARSLLGEARQETYAAQDELAESRMEIERVHEDARDAARRHKEEVEAMQAELDRGKDYADGLAEQLHEIQGTRLWRLAAAWWRVKAGIRGSRRTVG